MQVIQPTPSQAAFVLKKYFKEQGVDVKLGNAQEAVARMMGYGSWNVLATAMDPKVGVVSGPLSHGSGNEYEMTTGVQSYAWITIGNINVQIKHEDEGVVVDLWAKNGSHEESIASTYASFQEAEEEEDAAGDDEETRDRANADKTGADFAQELVLVRDIRDSSGPCKVVFRDVNQLQELAFGQDINFWEPLFTYKSIKEERTLTAGEIADATRLGESGWMLPDGMEVWVTTRCRNLQLDLDTEDLLTRLLDKDVRIGLPNTQYGIPLTSVDNREIVAVLNNLTYEPAKEVIHFEGGNGGIKGIALQALLKAYRESADSWRLPSGARLDVISGSVTRGE